MHRQQCGECAGTIELSQIVIVCVSTSGCPNHSPHVIKAAGCCLGKLKSGLRSRCSQSACHSSLHTEQLNLQVQGQTQSTLTIMTTPAVIESRSHALHESESINTHFCSFLLLFSLGRIGNMAECSHPKFGLLLMRVTTLSDLWPSLHTRLDRWIAQLPTQFPSTPASRFIPKNCHFFVVENSTNPAEMDACNSPGDSSFLKTFLFESKKSMTCGTLRLKLVEDSMKCQRIADFSFFSLNPEV